MSSGPAIPYLQRLTYMPSMVLNPWASQSLLRSLPQGVPVGPPRGHAFPDSLYLLAVSVPRELPVKYVASEK